MKQVTTVTMIDSNVHNKPYGIFEVVIETFEDVLKYLLKARHGEYIKIRFYDNNGTLLKEKVQRCWYNETDDCLDFYDGKVCYNMEKSQRKNAVECFNIIEDTKRAFSAIDDKEKREEYLREQELKRKAKDPHYWMTDAELNEYFLG